MGFFSKSKQQPRIVVENLNNKYNDYKSDVESIFNKKEAERQKKRNYLSDKVAYFIEFKGDVYASQVKHFREEISTILKFGKKGDDVIISLYSPGGTVTGYGLAADQIDRLKRNGFKVTVVVDEVAASGGYMMASVADKIVAANRAVVGSIGVVVNMPNYKELCDKIGVSWKDYTAGDKKRGVTPYSTPTKEQEADLEEDLKTVHASFKDHISQYRPNIDIEKVATGQTWSGKQALELNLIDEIGISDDVLFDYMNNDYLVLHVKHVEPKKKRGFLSRQMAMAMIDVVDHSMDKFAMAVVNAGLKKDIKM